MKKSKLKMLSICLALLILFLSTSSVSAMAKTEVEDTNKLLEAQKFAESIERDCVLINNETGTSVSLKNVSIKSALASTEDLNLISYNAETDESKYYKETEISIPIEVLDMTTNNVTGSFLGDYQVDPQTYSVSVRLGMYFTQGQQDGFTTFRVEGVHVDYNVSDPQAWFTKAEVGYQMEGVRADNRNNLNFAHSWLINNAARTCNRDYYYPSPYVKITGEWFIKRAVFAGTLARSTSSWSFVLYDSY